VILFFSFWGIFYALKKGWLEKHKTACLVFFWLLVPILRVSVPRTRIYGGVRQIMEFIPAMAVLSGLGAQRLFERLKNHFKPIFLFIIILSSFIPIALKMIAIHPNQNVYFNPLIGGLAGAKEADIPFVGDTLGNPYRQAAVWLNQNAEKDAKLVFGYEMMSNMPSIFLRDDIKLDNRFRSGFWKQGEYAFSPIDQGILENHYYTRYLDKIIEPVYEVKVDDVPILKLWKNDKEHTRKGYLDEVEILGLKAKIGTKEIDIDLKREASLSRIEVFYEEINCQPLEEREIRLSVDGKDWLQIPEFLPAHWLFAAIGPQDKGGKWVWAFTGQRTRFIRMKILPRDACFRKIKDVRAFEFSDLE